MDDARLIVAGQRSSLYECDGCVRRRYHDTTRWSEPPIRVDERGTRRFGHNVTEAALRRGGRRGGRPPPHLERARRVLLECAAIREVERRCGVRRSTAWQYVTSACEEADAARHVLACGGFVCPELEDAASRVDLRGSLTDVMARIEGELAGNTAWRCEEDRYAQLRLFRVCLTSLRRARASPAAP